jgi:hypothetical protein
MNILNKQIRTMAPSWGSLKYAVPKQKKFSWCSGGDRGVFQEIPRELLNIDDSYQREQISETKVKEIAKNLDWKLFGTVSVIRRQDGTFWVYDGGHRTRASFLRDDMKTIPCMIYAAESSKEEAMAFVGANTMKNTVSAFHKHRASVLAEEPESIAVQAIVEKNGYKVAHRTSHKIGEFAAIATLRKCVQSNRELADRVFCACAAIAKNGENISGDVIEGLFCLQEKLSETCDVLSGWYLARLEEVGMKGLEAAIRRQKVIENKGGQLVNARAIRDELNKGKRRKLSWS